MFLIKIEVYNSALVNISSSCPLPCLALALNASQPKSPLPANGTIKGLHRCKNSTGERNKGLKTTQKLDVSLLQNKTPLKVCCHS